MRTIRTTPITSMFSDKLRWIKMGGALFVLLLLILFHLHNSHGRIIKLYQCQEEPLRCVNTEVGFRVVVDGIEEGRFLAHQRKNKIWVKGGIDGLEINDLVSITGIYGEDGSLDMKDFYIHRLWRWKFYISLLAVIGVFIIFIIIYRFDVKRFIFLKR